MCSIQHRSFQISSTNQLNFGLREKSELIIYKPIHHKIKLLLMIKLNKWLRLGFLTMNFSQRNVKYFSIQNLTNVHHIHILFLFMREFICILYTLLCHVYISRVNLLLYSTLPLHISVFVSTNTHIFSPHPARNSLSLLVLCCVFIIIELCEAHDSIRFTLAMWVTKYWIIVVLPKLLLRF